MTIKDITQHATDGGRFAVATYAGIAFRYAGEHMEWSYTGDLDEREEVGTGMIVMAMVGDDYLHIIDPEDVTPLEDGAWCPGCGQIGCTAESGV